MTPTAGLALALQPEMIVQSDLLGPLTVAEDEILDFGDGLYGFPECRRFALIPAERDGLFWLQSLDHSTLVFVLVDPFHFFDTFSVDLSAADMEELGVTDPSDVVILAIVTLPGSREERPTANLQGPLAINLRLRTGRQLAVSESDFGVRCPFSL